MKELNHEKMICIKGGGNCEKNIGFGAGFAAATLIAGVATGGVGLLVMGGLAAYGTTYGAIYCAMTQKPLKYDNMKELNFEELSFVEGGGFISGACAGVAIGSAVYFVGAATNFWNPVGWLSAGFVAVDVACAIYTMT